MSSPRVLFVLKYREQPYGDCPYSTGWGGESPQQALSSGLYNSARLVSDMLAAEGIPTKVVHVHDGNDIHREVVAFKATVCVVEAFWCPPYKFDDLLRAVPHVRFVVRNHSETPFLAQEGIAFAWTQAYLRRPNVTIAPNSPRMLEDTWTLTRASHPHWSEEEIDERLAYLPNFYPVDLPVSPVQASSQQVPPLDVGCFGAVRPLKNHLIQAVGAIQAGQILGHPVRFHINAGRDEMGGAPVLKNLRNVFVDAAATGHELVEHGWLPHDRFRQLVRSMDVVSQVSYSETFNIVAADAASQFVPIVVSSEVPWAPASTWADPSSSHSVARAIVRAVRGGKTGASASRSALRAYSANSRNQWLRFLGVRP